MRELTPAEVISLRELLQMETNALAKSRVTQGMITDPQLKAQAGSGVLALEGKVKGLQQFITENNILSTSGVK